MPSHDPSANPSFPPTRWSLLLDLRSGDVKVADRALGELCRLYWYPVYAFVRREGMDAEDAQDLTQGFFTRLLARGDFLSVDQAKGKLRTYLLAGVKHFMVQDWRRRTAEKRGGGAQALPLEAAEAEYRYAQEPSDLASPDALFDRRWALDTMEEALRQVEEEYREAGKAELHAALQPFISAKAKADDFQALTTHFHMTEGSLHVAVHRLRQRFRKCLEKLVAETVSSPEEAGDELRHLLTLLVGG
jgi:DNA-directed RNA polymerase specialized sigma24 family protein